MTVACDLGSDCNNVISLGQYVFRLKKSEEIIELISLLLPILSKERDHNW